MVPSERREVVRVACSDDGAAEPDRGSDHRGVHGMARVQAVPPEEATRDAGYPMIECDNAVRTTDCAIDSRVTTAAPVDLGEHG